MNTQHEMNTLQELQKSISQAMNRVNTQKESDLCHYLPGSKGRLHHFVFGKLKKTRPEQLLKMIKEHILEKESPQQITSGPKPALMVKRTIDIKLKRSQINQLLNVLKASKLEIQGAEDLISMLAPHQTLGQVQKQMLDMIRAKEIDQGLWETYVRLVEEERAVLH